MRRKWMFIVVAAGLAVGMAGCDPVATGGEEEQPPTVGETPAPEPTGEVEAEAGQAAPPPGGVVASREVTDSGSDLQIDITELRRQGQTVTLTWRITVLSSDNSSGWRIGDSMGSGTNDFSVSGVTLVDPVNAQRYLVARSGGEDGECACTDSTNFYMSEGDEVEFFANYAAPSSDVSTVNVEFPRFGAFTDVPLS